MAKEQKIHIVAIFLCCVLNLHAQEFGTPWIHYPYPNTSSTVWFHHTYLSSQKPLSAFLAVAAKGNVEVFINEVPLTPPFYNNDDGRSVSFTFNIGKYLRRDSNTVAIHYLPDKDTVQNQGVSVCFYGRNRNGNPFAYYGNESWMCRLGNMHATDSLCEYHNYTQEGGYGSAQSSNYACWVSPTVTFGQLPKGEKPQKKPISSIFSTQIVIPKYFDVDKNCVEYEFGIGFYGFVRLTLRGTTAGERIYIGDAMFICSGKTDEQIFTRLSPSYYCRVRISGDDNFNPTQIQRTEGINLSYLPNNNYYYFTDP